MHVFLTGEIQVGKSTILRRWMAAHPDLTVGGFRTIPGPIDGDSDGVYIVPATGRTELREENRILLRRGVFPNRELYVYPGVFETVGVSLLERSMGCDVVLMDEIGVSENAATVFQQAVRSWLDNNTPVLGVVRNKRGMLTDLVRSHPKTSIITVTVENRETILKELLTWNG